MWRSLKNFPQKSRNYCCEGPWKKSRVIDVNILENMYLKNPRLLSQRSLNTFFLKNSGLLLWRSLEMSSLKILIIDAKLLEKFFKKKNPQLIPINVTVFYLRSLKNILEKFKFIALKVIENITFTGPRLFL